MTLRQNRTDIRDQIIPFSLSFPCFCPPAANLKSIWNVCRCINHKPECSRPRSSLPPPHKGPQQLTSSSQVAPGGIPRLNYGTEYATSCHVIRRYGLATANPLAITGAYHLGPSASHFLNRLISKSAAQVRASSRGGMWRPRRLVCFQGGFDSIASVSAESKHFYLVFRWKL